VRILVLDTLVDSLDIEQETAAALGASVTLWSGDRAALASADIVLHVRTRIDEELIAELDRCRVIGRFGTGLDTVDLDAARAASIEVVGVSDYCVSELATHTLALAFALERRLEDYGGKGQGAEPQWDVLTGAYPIRGRRRAAIIGFGRVGQAVASALIGLRYDVQVVTEHGRGAAEKLGVAVVDIEPALETAEYVFLHCSLTARSTKIIDARALALMPPGALLINTARLGLIDQSAVADSLSRGELGGLALDALVLSSSPLQEFVDDRRVLITPHVGWYSERTMRRLREETVRRAVAACASKRTRTEVSS
jgi:D-3-phosphoglycerate dehydrogenase / 2-oxoglutarate reductase